MKVALGTLEIDEDTRKRLGKAVVGSSYLKREQARDWALGLINGELERVRNGGSKPEVTADPTLTPPSSAPKDADSLPEPVAPAII